MRSLTASHWCMRRRGHLRMYADVANPAAAVHCRGQAPCGLVSIGLDLSMFHWFWSDEKSAFSEGMYIARSVHCSEHLEQVLVLCWLLLPPARSVAGGATCFATGPRPDIFMRFSCDMGTLQTGSLYCGAYVICTQHRRSCNHSCLCDWTLI